MGEDVGGAWGVGRNLDILGVSVAKCELSEYVFVFIAIVAKCCNKKEVGRLVSQPLLTPFNYIDYFHF